MLVRIIISQGEYSVCQNHSKEYLYDPESV